MSEAMTIDVDPSNRRQLRDWDGEHGQYGPSTPTPTTARWPATTLPS